jgi:hypothetical protein
MRLNCLPRPGGLLDQDGFDVWRMLQVIQALDEKDVRDAKKKPGQRDY